MRSAQDTFLKFLADNLDTYQIHPVRRDPDNPDNSVLASGAVNVQFHGHKPRYGDESTMRVFVDCIEDNELKALDMAEAVFELLSVQYMTPKFDYSVPTTPQSTGTNLSWKPDQVEFKPVWDEYYYRLRCDLNINYIKQ